MSRQAARPQGELFTRHVLVISEAMEIFEAGINGGSDFQGINNHSSMFFLNIIHQKFQIPKCSVSEP